MINLSAHVLTKNEQSLVESRAITYFESGFPIRKGQEVTMERGVFLECAPVDANDNKLVNCKGHVPQQSGGYIGSTRYCSYHPTRGGCYLRDSFIQ